MRILQTFAAWFLTGNNETACDATVGCTAVARRAIRARVQSVGEREDVRFIVLLPPARLKKDYQA